MSVTYLFLILFFCSYAYDISLMIEPAGDAQHAGRIIDDCFERGIALQCAESLKKQIEQTYPGVRIILSRFPGESLEQLQNANFANRLGVDLYISLHFYQESQAKHTITFYYFSYNNVTDFWHKRNDELAFVPYDKAHFDSIGQSKSYATLFFDTFSKKEFNSLFDVREPIGIPFKPLIGIALPAIAIEASLKKKEDWKLYCKPIIDVFDKVCYGSGQ